MSCGTKEAIVFTLGLISGTGTTLYVACLYDLCLVGVGDIQR